MHQGQLRKGTQTPYIFHPLEVLNILRAMKADANLQVAGVLHDTIEDTEATYQDILDRFGPDVAELVNAHTEDKSKTWEERKTYAIEHLAKGDRRLKMLVLADKVSNLRSIAANYEFCGDSLWDRFNAPMAKQSWYYSGIQDALWDMQKDSNVSEFYWEMVGLYKDVFVNYFWRFPDEDGNGEALFQIAAHGECMRLDRGNPQWKPSAPPERDTVIGIGDRESAVEMEFSWNEPFWECHRQDRIDATYILTDTNTRHIEIQIENDGLILNGEDFGPACTAINGKNSYEYHISLDVDNTKRLLVQLRIDCGIECNLQDVFEKSLGNDSPMAALKQYCDERCIEYRSTSF